MVFLINCFSIPFQKLTALNLTCQGNTWDNSKRIYEPLIQSREADKELDTLVRESNIISLVINRP
jgi:hypothetical protein